MVRIVLDLLDGSKMSTDNLEATLIEHNNMNLVQDRYSVRCLPQYLGSILETPREVIQTLDIEINSANDNPLVDVETP